jgi:hypothetical protein
MRTIPFCVFVIAALPIACSGNTQQSAGSESLDQSLGTALTKITPAFVKAHISFLGDDLLEGRGTGTKGYDLAAKHVAATFEAMGLEPAGDDGSYFQRVPLIETSLDPAATTLTLEPSGGRKETLVFGRDYVSSGSAFDRTIAISAPVVFVGHGVEAPEQQHNDYANVEVAGKVVVALFDGPAKFPSSARAHYSSSLVKRQTAVAHGAVGFLQIASPALEKLYPWDLLSADARRAILWVDQQGRPADVFPELRVTGWLSAEGAKKMLGTKVAADIFSREAAGEPTAARTLDTVLAANISSVQRHFDSSNAAAIYRGAELPNQFVVYSAHLDHMGVGASVDNDNIYNGVLDNASGVAGMLAVANAFSSLRDRPRRSVMFVAVTGEEMGLVGSDYFARTPTVPADAMVANVNLDGLPLLYDFADIIAYGSEHSTIAEPVRRAAERLDLELTPDPFPEQVFFVRSDHYSFVKQGVPAVFATEGMKAIDPAVNGRASFDGWMATRYHRPNDDLQQPLNFTAAAKGAQFQFLIGYHIATDAAVPRWNEGDFFGQRFGRRRE